MATPLKIHKTSKQTTDPCQCGEITGVACDRPAEVHIKWMPPQYRDSHTAARNSGRWPHNGSVALCVSSQCAEELDETEGTDWISR